ncbi:MAG: hypothetical protein AAF420_14360 [Pseudomonadota bacterium]
MADLRSPENLINLTSYPLTTRGSRDYSFVVNDVRKRLDMDGAASMPGFIRDDAIALMASEANALAPLAYAGPKQATPYFFNYDLATNHDPSHPTNRTSKRDLGQVAYDLIPPEAALYRLYHWAPLQTFLADILGYEKLYPMTDHFQSLNISIMEEGGCQQWHFDRGHFVTTLLLQEAESGGVFEYAPNIREEQDEHFDRVQQVLDGDKHDLRQIRIEAGMLNLFKGHYSMHRVTPVVGKRRRIQTALAYSPEPNRVGNLASSLLHYGPRVAVRAGLRETEANELLRSICNKAHA